MIIKINDIPDKLSGVYKIVFPNNKVYIGISNNIKRRIREHNHNKKNYPVSRAIRKYGKITEIEILKIEEDREKLYEYEKYYIKKYDSLVHHNGYNISYGGKGLSHGKYFKKNKPSEPEYVQQIIDEIKRNRYTLDEIAKSFNVSEAVVSDINRGVTYKRINISYPIRSTHIVHSKILNEEQIKTIQQILQNDYQYKMEKIAQDFQVSISTIQRINEGLSPYYDKNIIYPIRKKNQNFYKFTLEEVKEIINLLKNSNLTQIEIAKSFNCGRELIGKINSGKKYYIEGEEYPIRMTAKRLALQKGK